jgi:flagellar biogenesis protein FliO
MFLLRDQFVNSVPAISVAGNSKSIWRRILSALRFNVATDGGLEHLGTLALTTHATVSLVRWQDRTLLLGITQQTVTLLTSSEEVKPHSVQEAPPFNRSSTKEHKR